MKECSKCGNNKGDKCFHKNTKAKSGLQSICKACRKRYETTVYVPKEFASSLAKYSASRIKLALSYAPSIVPRRKISIPTPNYALMIDRIKLSEPIEDYSDSMCVGDWNTMSKTEQNIYYERN